MKCQYFEDLFFFNFSKLKSVGQKVGAAGVLCHIRRSDADNRFVLNVANVGDTESVISRHGEAVPLSRLFVVNKDMDERQRICKSDGIITEVCFFFIKINCDMFFTN